MTSAEVYLVAAVAIMMIGLFGVFAQEHVLRKLVALNLFGSGVFLLYVAVAARVGVERLDPVPHAMVLTGIVISVSATALGLVLARRVRQLTGRVDLSERDEP